MLKLSWHKYSLQLRHPFTISNFSRTETPVVFTEIEYNGTTGYGEASLPPYLAENQESVIFFLKKVDLSKYKEPLNISNIMKNVDSVMIGNTAAKAAIDIALYDLVGKLNGKSISSMLEIDSSSMPLNCITIGIDANEIVRKKVKEAEDFRMLKVKVGSDHDKELIRTIREETDKPICVDANQGWKSKEEALEMIHWLKEQGIVFIEQPLKKNSPQDMRWLKERSPLPLIADEDMQRLSEVEKLQDQFHGINIKLMKCTGLTEALEIIKKARKLEMKILIGCMNESSCANLAAAHFAPLADWVDLDGPYLITNNPFKDPEMQNGKIVLPDRAGIGLERK